MSAGASPAVDTSDAAWRQSILALSMEGLGLRSLYQQAPAAHIASICSTGFGSQTNPHLCSAVADFNSFVPLIRRCALTPSSQHHQTPKKSLLHTGHSHVQSAVRSFLHY